MITNPRISVDDKLPKDGEEVLCYEDKYGMYVTKFINESTGEMWFLPFDEVQSDCCSPTHWKYLPDTPSDS
jgi:hypothetical protein